MEISKRIDQGKKKFYFMAKLSQKSAVRFDRKLIADNFIFTDFLVFPELVPLKYKEKPPAL